MPAASAQAPAVGGEQGEARHPHGGLSRAGIVTSHGTRPRLEQANRTVSHAREQHVDERTSQHPVTPNQGGAAGHPHAESMGHWATAASAAAVCED